MKTELLIFSLIILLFVGCQKDEPQYPKTVIPEIRTETNELYSNPNRKFIIRAELKDEIGLRDVRIKIPELYLDKIISFPTDSLIKNYLLSYVNLYNINTLIISIITTFYCRLFLI